MTESLSRKDAESAIPLAIAQIVLIFEVGSHWAVQLMWANRCILMAIRVRTIRSCVDRECVNLSLAMVFGMIRMNNQDVASELARLVPCYS
jgi:hypothetical protein